MCASTYRLVSTQDETNDALTCLALKKAEYVPVLAYRLQGKSTNWMVIYEGLRVLLKIPYQGQHVLCKYYVLDSVTTSISIIVLIQ